MQYASNISLLAALAAFLAGPTLAATPDTGSVPATKHQLDTLRKAPEDVTTTRSPEARGTTTYDMPTSPHQGRVVQGIEPRFSDYDINRDGHISATEGQSDPQLESDWHRLDRNGDDQLDRSEFAAFEPSAAQGQ